MKTALNRYPISTIAGLCICLSATASATHLSHLGVFAPTFPVSTIRSRELLTAAYWFTASTSFANPAVTIARSLSDTFAGIRPSDVAPFIGAPGGSRGRDLPVPMAGPTPRSVRRPSSGALPSLRVSENRGKTGSEVLQPCPTPRTN